VQNAWSQVLKAILMWLTAEAHTQRSIVSAFYVHNGQTLGDLSDVVISEMSQGVNKPADLSCVRDCSYTTKTSAAVRRAETSILRRCLVILRDPGNPEMVAGLCWWRDYGGLLAKAGLLEGLRKARGTSAMSFGDGPSELPLFYMLQVPLWY
jgi:hypothetical protein